MTCPARLTVRTQGWLKMEYQVPCKKGEAHKGAHDADLSKLPLDFEGAKGVWAAKIRL